MKKISVIIPAFNVEDFIIDCLVSLENQTYKDFEVVVIDDGSTDKTFELVSDYAKEHNNVIVVHQENGGVCAARNKGLEVATGEYITFVDADDYLLPESLQFLYEDLVLNDADISVGAVNKDSETNIGDGSCEVLQYKQGIEHYLKDDPLLYGCYSKLIKKSFLGDTRFVVGRKIHEDGYFVFCLMIKEPKIVIRHKCAYVYRYNPNSASHARFSEKFFDVLYFEKIKREIILKDFPQLTDLAYNNLVKAHLTMLHVLCTTKDKKYNKDVKASIKAVKKYSKYFIPAVAGEKKFFLIVKLGLYGLFRRIYWLKYKVN